MKNYTRKSHLLFNTVKNGFFGTIICMAVGGIAWGQVPGSGSVGIGHRDTNPKAILDIYSTNKGLLIPRVTNQQMGFISAGIPGPTPQGLMVYNTEVGTFFYWNGTVWVPIGAGGGGGSGWELTGNSNVIPGTSFLGTNTPAGLDFKTDGLTRMSILGAGLAVGPGPVAGNIGVGVAAPLGKVHIKSTDPFSPPLVLEGLQLGNPLTDNGLTIDPSNGRVGYFDLRAALTPAWTLSGNKDNLPTAFFGTTDTQPLSIRTNNTERMRILGGGNIGIGTPLPMGKLHIVGNPLPGNPPALVVQGLQQAADPILGEGDVLMTVHPLTGVVKMINPYTLNSTAWNIVGNTGNAPTAFFGTTDAQPISIKTNNTERMRIESSSTPLKIMGLPTGSTNPLAPDRLLTINPTTNAVGQVDATTLNSIVWNTLGNAGTTPANPIPPLQSFFGTTDAQPVAFRINNTERMRMHTNGRIGIGAAGLVPSSILHVEATGTDNPLTLTGLQDGSTALPTPDELLTVNANGVVRKVNATALTPIVWATLGNGGTTPNSPIPPLQTFMGTTDNQPLSFRTNNLPRIRILGGDGATGGNVGIGTVAPTNRLHVVAGANPVRLEGLQPGATTDDVLTINATGVVTRTAVADLGAANAWSITGNSAVTSANHFLGPTNNEDLVIRTNNLPRAIISRSGRVGIGRATSPSSTLEVGAIGTEDPLRLIGLKSGAATDSILTVDAATGTIRKRNIDDILGGGGGGAPGGPGVAWSTRGNNGINSFNDFLGPLNNNADLRFRVGGDVKLSINPRGVITTYQTIYIDGHSKNEGIFSDFGLDFPSIKAGPGGVGEALSSTEKAGGPNEKGWDFWTRKLRRMSIGNDGRICIGGNGLNPTAMLHLRLTAPETNLLRLEGLNNGVAGDQLLTVNANGDVRRATFAVMSGVPSDMRYKKDVFTMTNGLNRVLALQPVAFNYRVDEFRDKNLSDKHQYGLIAQDVEKIVPEAVSKDAGGFYSINYNVLMPFLIQAVKEQQAEIDILKKDKQTQQAQVDGIKKQMAELQAMLQIMLSKKRD